MILSDITYTEVSCNEELHQILELQQRNLFYNVSDQEKRHEGFVTVEHNLDILKKMNEMQAHIIAKDKESVIGYALSMTKDFANSIPILRALFEKTDTLIPTHQRYIVMGQICIDKKYRKQGVFRGLYKHMKSKLMKNYDLLITEVASNNSRSLHAHYAVGFTNLQVYQNNGVEWNIVQWNWK